MKIAPIAGVKAKLSASLHEAETGGPVVITRNGKAVALLIAPLNDDDLESLMLSRSPRFKALLDRSRQSIKSGRGIPHDRFWKAVVEPAKKKAKSGRRSLVKAS
jgi:antitoxin (DNA-binding transcriptional repressor) of toxin-antitoxin stability system